MTARYILAGALSIAAGAATAADRAVVIGIDTYPQIGLDHALTGAAADATRFADFLTSEMGFADGAVTLLTDDQATSAAIMNALIDRIVGETGPGDRAIFYFAGLGSRILARTGDEPDGLDEVILAYDTAAPLGKIPESAISDILDIIANRDVTVLIDASFGGGNGFGAATGFGSVPRDVTLADDGQTNPDSLAAKAASGAADSFAEPPFGTGQAPRNVWNAAAPGQFAWETDTGGVFTASLIDGLKGDKADANGNGTITNAELLSYLRETSEAWCAADIGCASSDAGLSPNFSGPVQGVVTARTEPEPVAAEGPALLDFGDRPVTYEQTLGFVTDLFAPSNDANLTLAINAPTPLKIGDVVSFTARADHAGTLVLFDINPKGELAQLFPSSLAPDSATRIEAGVTATIPEGQSLSGKALQIRAGEPAGQGFLLGILIEDDMPDLLALLPENLSGGPIPNAGQYLYEIAQELLKLQASADGNRRAEWSATHLPYEIVR